MSKKLSFLIALVLLLGIAGDVSADVSWVGDGNDPNWNTGTNWSNNAVPTANDVIFIHASADVLIQNGVAAVGQKVLLGQAGADTASLTMTGGSLSLQNPYGWAYLGIGQFNTGESILNLHGGSITILGENNASVVCGYKSKGIINMTGGTLDCGPILKVGVFYQNPTCPDSNGLINLDGGTITADELVMTGSGRINIKAGTLIVDGNCMDVIAGYAGEPNNWITAYDGNDGGGKLVVDYDIRNLGKTTITAISGDSYLPKLTINVEPNELNNLGVDSIVPKINEPIYYWKNKLINIGAGPSTKCPYVYRFDHWQGNVDPNSDSNSPSVMVFMDADKTVTAVFFKDERRCGDECHPILEGDLNRDCYINLEDWALYAGKWLDCTHPVCDPCESL